MRRAHHRSRRHGTDGRTSHVPARCRGRRACCGGQRLELRHRLIGMQLGSRRSHLRTSANHPHVRQADARTLWRASQHTLCTTSPRSQYLRRRETIKRTHYGAPGGTYIMSARTRTQKMTMMYPTTSRVCAEDLVNLVSTF